MSNDSLEKIRTEKNLPKIKEYYLSLGKFISEYSEVEQHIHIVLMVTAKVSAETAKVIFANTSISNAMSFISKIHLACKDDFSGNFIKSINQLTIINEHRNIIIHNKFGMANDFFIAGKKYKKLDGHEKIIETSPEVLDKMTADLYTIKANFQVFILHQKNLPISESLENDARAPWLYKPLQQFDAH